MRLRLSVSVIMLCAFGSGCRLADRLVRTTIVEPLGYARFVEERRERVRFRHLAECALAEEKARVRAELDDYECEPFSVDEQCGFLDGFADYLDAGGTGNPPPLPPRRYWRTEHENICGYQAVQDWYRGYAHGVSTAQASGYRELVTICTSDSLGAFLEPHYPGQDCCLIEPPVETAPHEQDVNEPSRLVMRSPDDPIQLPPAQRDAAASPQVTMEVPLTPPARPQAWRGDDPPPLESAQATIATTTPGVTGQPAPTAQPPLRDNSQPDSDISAIVPAPPPAAKQPAPTAQLPLGDDPRPKSNNATHMPTRQRAAEQPASTPPLNFSPPSSFHKGKKSAGLHAGSPYRLEPQPTSPLPQVGEVAQTADIAIVPSLGVWPSPYRAPQQHGEAAVRYVTPPDNTPLPQCGPDPLACQRLPAINKDNRRPTTEPLARVLRLPAPNRATTADHTTDTQHP